MANPTTKHIVVENSAPSQARPAESVVWGSRVLRKEGAKKVVELGCGRLRNLPPLLNAFSNVSLVDTKLQCDRVRDLLPKSGKCTLMTVEEFTKSKGQFDAAFVISVLHTMPNSYERRGLLRLAYERLKRGGCLLVDVPQGETYYARRCGRHNAYKDGWLMSRGSTFTFYKNFKLDELLDLVESSGNWDVYDRLTKTKHLIRLFRKIT